MKMISSLIFMGLLIGFYLEMQTPGFGVFGTLGLGCLILIILNSFAVQAVHWIELVLLGAGILFLVMELFVIPGFGIIGIIGILLTLGSLFALMLPGIDALDFTNFQTFGVVGSELVKRLAYLSVALVLAIGVIFLLSRLLKRTFFQHSPLVHRGEAPDAPEVNMPSPGEEGEVKTLLSPSGKVKIGEEFYSAVAETGYIENGASVVVVSVEGTKLIVREKKC